LELFAKLVPRLVMGSSVVGPNIFIAWDSKKGRNLEILLLILTFFFFLIRSLVTLVFHHLQNIKNLVTFLSSRNLLFEIQWHYVNMNILLDPRPNSLARRSYLLIVKVWCHLLFVFSKVEGEKKTKRI